MSQLGAMRRSYVLYSLPLLAALNSVACQHRDDCKLYDTCADSLLKHAKKLAGSMADACEECLQACTDELLECNRSAQCIYTSKCMLEGSPRNYQDCLLELYQGGYTRGTESKHPWEGEKNTFGRCLHAKCRASCIEAPYVCDDVVAGLPSQLKLRIAMRSYPGFVAMGGVTLRACDERSCGHDHTTDDAGMVDVDDPPKGLLEDTLHFQIDALDAGANSFPFTRYYPGRFGEQDLQLLSVYVVRSSEIALGNEILWGKRVVFEDAGQSLILPDSCVWEEISAKRLRIRIEDGVANKVDQCHALGRTPCDEAGVCTPCVWYSNQGVPDLKQQLTDGTGGGVVGLGDGLVNIRVEQEDGGVVASRTIRMEAGTMTIARTWPLPESEQRALSSAKQTSPSDSKPSPK